MVCANNQLADVPNPMFYMPGTKMLFGDAKTTCDGKLVQVSCLLRAYANPGNNSNQISCRISNLESRIDASCYFCSSKSRCYKYLHLDPVPMDIILQSALRSIQSLFRISSLGIFFGCYCYYYLLIRVFSELFGELTTAPYVSSLFSSWCT